MNRTVLVLVIFFVVSITALFFMKAILWTLFLWGGKIAVPLAFILGSVYFGSLHWAKSMKNLFIAKSVLTWIWVIGFMELLVLGGLYHLIPQFFPAVVGDFFFN